MRRREADKKSIAIIQDGAYYLHKAAAVVAAVTTFTTVAAVA